MPLFSENPAKKSVRPLSANRKSSSNSAWTDTNADASAVMAALKAENEQASKFGREDKAVKRTPRPGSARDIPSPIIDKTERPPKTHQIHSQQERVQRSSLVHPDKIDQIMDKVMKMTPK